MMDITTKQIKGHTIIVCEARDNVSFKCIPPAKDEEEAKMLQAECGYMWQGYGFYNLKQNTTASEWKCYRSCD